MKLKILMISSSTILLSSSIVTLTNEVYKTGYINSISQPLLSEGVVIDGKWIDQSILLSDYQKDSNLQLIKSTKTLEIKLLSAINSQLIFNVFAKTPQKIHQFVLNASKRIVNNNYIESEVIKDKIGAYVENRFYQDKTQAKFLSSDKYFALFDTSEDNEGKIIDNGEVGFRSSWGRTNSSRANSRFMFNLQENTLKNHIILQEEQTWGKLNYKDIDILTIQPTRFGLFPFVRIYNPPIANATWTTNKIYFNDNSSYKKYLNIEQKLQLPEGHDDGQEWWNWFKSFGGTLISILALTVGIINFITGGPISGILSIAISIGLLVADIMHKIKGHEKTDSLILKKILNDKKDVQKIYNYSMTDSFKLNNSPIIDFKNLKNRFLSTYFDGELFGEAWSTAAFGTYSSMDLYTMWGAMNANIKYLVYK